MILIILILTGFSAIIAMRVVIPQKNKLNDFFQYWLAGNMVRTNRDPYDSDLWSNGHFEEFNSSEKWSATFIYPLPTAVLFIPLSFLSYEVAYTAWVFISILSIFSAAIIFIDLHKIVGLRKGKDFKYLLPILIGIGFFRPVFPQLHNGQIGAFLLFIIVLSTRFFQRGQWFLGGVLIMVSTLKPQLGIPLIALLAFWVLINNNWATLYGMVVGGILILIAGWMIDLDWISTYFRIGPSSAIQKIVIHPSIWGAANFVCNYNRECATTLGIIGSGFIIGTFIYILIRYRNSLLPIQTISLAICVVLSTTIKLWVYDQILLIVPLIHGIMNMIKKHLPYIVIASTFLIVDILVLFLLFLASKLKMDTWNLSITIFALLFTLWSISEHSDAQKTNRDSQIK